MTYHFIYEDNYGMDGTCHVKIEADDLDHAWWKFRKDTGSNITVKMIFQCENLNILYRE
jgi:hypothetical protein